MKHPLTVHALNEGTYSSQVKSPEAKGHYPRTFAQFLAKHPEATHGVFDAEERLIYIGKESDLRAAHRKR